MSLSKFIEKHNRYVEASLTTRIDDGNDDGYLIFLKSQYRFFHWTPKKTYFKRNIVIDKSEWRNGLGGDTIMKGFYYAPQSGKVQTITGVCRYVEAEDTANIVTPLEFSGYSIDWLNLAWVENYKDIYLTKPQRKTDDSPKQKAAGIGATRSKKILSVSDFDKFAKSKGFKAKFADTKEFVSFMFKHSKDLFGRSSLKGMSWTAIYNLNPNSADWIGWSKIDTDDFLKYVKQYSKKTK